MLRLSIEEIIKKIKQEEIFEAVADDYSFTLKINKYVPYACGAVHDGHQFRKELWSNCLHTAYERWFEEDPATKQMVQSHPIVIAGMDSRFEYDLNRAPETAIYNDAWGKQLWKNPLSKEMHEKSLQKHANFYKVVHALINKLEEKFDDFSVYEKELNQSFGYYHHYYPKTPIPFIVTFYSNFNAKSFPYKDTLGIGLDLFLGRDEEIVSYLAPEKYPQYLKQDMDPEYLVSETMKSWVYANHSRPQEYANSTLYGVREDFLSSLIYHGKMILLLEATTPNKSIENRFSFTEKELDTYITEKGYKNEIIKGELSKAFKYLLVINSVFLLL
mgnify:CR=1 FL=1